MIFFLLFFFCQKIKQKTLIKIIGVKWKTLVQTEQHYLILVSRIIFYLTSNTRNSIIQIHRKISCDYRLHAYRVLHLYELSQLYNDTDTRTHVL